MFALGNGGTMDDYYDFHPFDETCKIFDTQLIGWIGKESKLFVK